MAGYESLCKMWQTAMEKSKDRLRHLYTTGEYSDLDIVFPEYEMILKAHKIVLSMSSPVFGAMLMGPMADGKEIKLLKDCPHALQKLLDHIYLDEIDLGSVEEALDVYALAEKYMMECVKRECLQYTLSNLSEETVLAALETSSVYGEVVLKEKCKEILNKNPAGILSSKTVSCLSRKTLRDLLLDNTIKFPSEIVTFKGLIAWGKAQPSHQERPSGSVLREVIGDLLKEVRFLTLTCDEFVDNVVDTNVLSYAECIHILRVIRGANPSTVPETTPLNLSREERSPVFGEMGELVSCNLDFIGSKTWYSSHSNVGLIENLVCNTTIKVQCFKVLCGCIGIIRILDKGKVVGSATSEDGLFNFKRPPLLHKGKRYKVTFLPKASISLYGSAQAGKKSVGNITISFTQAHDCTFYFLKAKLK